MDITEDAIKRVDARLPCWEKSVLFSRQFGTNDIIYASNGASIGLKCRPLFLLVSAAIHGCLYETSVPWNLVDKNGLLPEIERALGMLNWFRVTVG